MACEYFQDTLEAFYVQKVQHKDTSVSTFHPNPHKTNGMLNFGL